MAYTSQRAAGFAVPTQLFDAQGQHLITIDSANDADYLLSHLNRPMRLPGKAYQLLEQKFLGVHAGRAPLYALVTPCGAVATVSTDREVLARLLPLLNRALET